MSFELRNVHVFDGTGTPTRAGVTITIDGGTISDVRAEHRHDDVATAGPAVAGLTVLPGLIDLHTHLGAISATQQGTLSPSLLAARVFENARLALEAGFTTVRECGGVDGGVAEVIASGLIPGPRIFPSGPLLCQSGGHGDLRPRYHGADGDAGIPGLARISEIVDGPAAMRRAAREAFRNGATQLKVCISGGVISTTDAIDDLQFGRDELRAAVEEARSRGSYVTGHAMTNAAVRHGLSAGLECFEHVPRLDRRTAEEMREAGAAYVSTLAVARLMVDQWQVWGVPEEALPRLSDLATAGLRALEVAEEAGLVVGSGSDLLGPAQNRRGLEIGLKASVLGAARALNIATEMNARILRREDLGTIAPGKTADLIAVEFDPLTEVQLFDDPDRIRLVVKDGAVVKNTVADRVGSAALVPG